VRVDLPGIQIAGADTGSRELDIEMETFNAEMKALREAVAEAKASGNDISERVAARLEAAAERAQEQMERAQERAAERAAQRAERAQRAQLAAAEPPGPITKESRTVGDFSGVSFGGAGKVFITVGPKASVVLEADAQTLSRTKTEVDDEGVLRIRRRGDDHWGPRGDITAHITVPSLKLARVSGSGDLKVTGLNGGETDLSISGSGNVEAQGKLQKLDVSISGSGSAKMEGLVVNEAEVSISGSGSAIVDVRESLDVRVSGSGSVRYLSQPKDIDTSISGSGSVRRRDAT
jgi:multidrug efflux pump subunit AcrA (membrane-fusion protein)